jgi:DNA repair photolyase
MKWDKVKITKENGEIVEAHAPVIISASRSTDIPAFYSDWFFHRLNVGYSIWTNPFNGDRINISYEKTRLIVFWSKNPEPLIVHLDELKKKDINCYIQFTINDYVNEGLEKGVSSVDKRVNTFKKLVDKLGFGKVIWRFDPLILTDNISIDNLLDKISRIGNQLQGYTEKMVFSFADISAYGKVKSNLEKNNVNYREFNDEDMQYFASGIYDLNKNWKYELATCAEKTDFTKYGILHNRCVDDDIMIKYFLHDKILMEYLGVKVIEPDMFNLQKQIVKTKNNEDKGQREACGCIISKDIGEYNTCPHLCDYCYANNSKEKAMSNYKQHGQNMFSETITGK